jgi:hypothetical protein
MFSKKPRIKEKPGTVIMSYGVVACGLAIIFTIVSLFTTHTDAYGYTTHGGVSAGSVTMFLLGLVLLAIGFCRRLLYTLENRGPQS